MHKESGKVYIGKTGANPWKERWRSHKNQARRGKETYLYNAIRIHSAEDFDIVKIDETFSNEAANELEKYYIKTFQSYKRNKGYNLTFGGDGVPMTPEIKQKMSESLRGRKLSEETKAKIASAGRGKKHSEETKKKQAEWHRGRTIPPEVREKISKTVSIVQKGTHHTEETKARMRVAQQLRRSSEKNQTNFIFN